MRHLPILLLAIAAIAGCTSNPPHAQSAPPVAAQNAPSAAAAPQAASNSAGDAKLASRYPPGTNLDLIKRGYSVGQKNGDLVYCRSEAPTGSRFTQKVCLSEAQIRENEARAKDALMHRPTNN